MEIKDLEKKYAKSLKSKKYDEDDIALEIGLGIAEARIRAGLTQKELAKKMNTKQPSIARVENGFSMASITFLNNVARALQIDLILPKFSFETKVDTQAKAVKAVYTERFMAPPLLNGLCFIQSVTNESSNLTS